MCGLRLIHHDLEVHLYPDQHQLRATDHIYTSGDGADFLFYLGKAFTVTEAFQGERKLTPEAVEDLRSAKRYILRGWDHLGPEVTLKWEGFIERFEGSCVCIISPNLVELSGFCHWFPTIEQTSQMERFTYHLDVRLPADWDLLTPGISHRRNPKERRYEWLRPAEDIFICAAPRFDFNDITVSGHLSRLYTSGLLESQREALASDFRQSLKLMYQLFGPMVPGCGGTGIISPRGSEGAEWGFERGDLWVMGDSMVQPMLQNNWVLGDFMPEPISLALHETIHAWIGLGLEFAEPSLFEAITQYLQNVLGEVMFKSPGLACKYFESYVPRIKEQLAKDDRSITSLTYNDYHYVQWYLKGSWAFWDLEVSIGRSPLLQALSSVYRKYAGREIDYDTFVRELALSLDADVSAHFDHWFKEPGFEPLHRKET